MIKYRIFGLFLALGLLISCQNPDSGGKNETQEKAAWAIAIHGGAGVILKENMSDSVEMLYREKLSEAISVGKKILEAGGSCLDAVEQTIRIMEDSPLFNAGKGAVFTHEGHNELDAAVMDGSNLMAGAAAGVGDIKNPISLARKIMTDSDHVMLSGAGASEFARSVGIEVVDSAYFYTDRRWQALQNELKKANQDKFGTVGCVALDQQGNLAAGTSTGGMTNKRWNRIGDTPVIGAGTYASNKSCAVSGTGHGEYFIRYTVAREIAALMEYAGMDVHQAATEVVQNRLKPAGGEGGIIALDYLGNICFEFNTPGMYRAAAKPGHEVEVAIFQ